MSKHYIGVDPGKEGALVIYKDFSVVETVPFKPVSKTKGADIDVTPIVSALIPYVPTVAICVVEKVGAMPGQGVSSMFSFGYHTGTIIGVLKAFRLSVARVTPQKWKSVVLAGTTKDKQAAIAHCKNAYPSANLLASSRSRKPSDGICDAICIAEYAFRSYSGQV